MKLIAAILIALLMVGCIGSKKTTESSVKRIENVKASKDSTSTIATNKKIQDQVIINVPKTDNKEVMDAVIALMERMNTSKISGSNSYKSTFDKEAMQWIVEFAVGQTKDVKTEVIDEKETEKTFEENANEYIKKTVIPWWLYVVAFIVAFPFIKSVILLFFPAAKLILPLRR